MSTATAPRPRGRRQAMPPLPYAPVGKVHTDDEVAHRIAEASGLPKIGIKPDPRPIQNGTTVYDVFRRIAKKTGQAHGRTSMHQVASRVYDDVVSYADVENKRRALTFAFVRLKAAGVLHVWPEVGPDGEWRGLRWELIDEPVDPGLYASLGLKCAANLLGPRRSSSVG